MTDEVFSPHPAPPLSVPGSAEVVYLRAALFVLRGTFHDPIAGEQRPLPPHRWVLVHSETVFSEGKTSDEDGISTIFAPSIPEDMADDATWELWLVPIYPGRIDSDPYAEDGEAWIDVEQHTWATREAVRDGILSKVTARKLLRVPFWTSTRQATHGGFDGGPPQAAQWAETGTLSTSELVAFGTRDEPWSIAIDHGWMRTYVQLRYYDFVARQEKPIPQGVVLRALAKDGREVGGGSIRLDDGAIYVLHEHPPEMADEFEYLFGANKAMFELENGKLEAATDFEPEHLETHYLLPSLWSSNDVEAWTGGADASAAVRKPFIELRIAGQDPAEPLCFHLDDAVLTDQFKKPLDAVQERVCILDSNLAIRDQASNDVGLVPWSERTLTSPHLRAEEYVFERGEGIERLTRVFECGGWLYALDLERVSGGNMLGTRAATRVGKSNLFANHDWLAPLKLTLHLVDTRYLRVAVGDASPKLAHLLIYQGFHLDMKTVTKGKSEIEHAMFLSSLQWDQKHPAHDRPEPRKDYVIVSRRDPLSESSTAVKLRHHFGLRTSAQRLPEFSGSSPDEHAQIFVGEVGRANMGEHMELFLALTGEKVPSSAPFHFGPTPKTAAPDRLDEVADPEFTLAHELGHAIGLPDEYRERWTPVEKGTHKLPRFDQPLNKAHFAFDFVSFMSANRSPRLRYVWPFARELERLASTERDGHWLKSIVPYQVRYRDLRYFLPDKLDPWTAAHEGPQGRCSLSLYALGDDESSRGPMFTTPPTLFDPPFDGVVVVVCNLWFDFESSFVGKARRHWNLIVDRLGSYENRASAPKFFIEAPAGAASYLRVPIIIMPRYQYAPAPSQDERRPNETLGDASVEVVVFGGRRAAPNKDLTKTPPRIRVHKSGVGHGLLRFALDPQSQPDDDLRRPLSAADLEPVNRWLASCLGRKPGTIRAHP
jgi:hypothetical protein